MDAGCDGAFAASPPLKLNGEGACDSFWVKPLLPEENVPVGFPEVLLGVACPGSAALNVGVASEGFPKLKGEVDGLAASEVEPVAAPVGPATLKLLKLNLGGAARGGAVGVAVPALGAGVLGFAKIFVLDNGEGVKAFCEAAPPLREGPPIRENKGPLDMGCVASAFCSWFGFSEELEVGGVQEKDGLDGPDDKGGAVASDAGAAVVGAGGATGFAKLGTPDVKGVLVAAGCSVGLANNVCGGAFSN